MATKSSGAAMVEMILALSRSLALHSETVQCEKFDIQLSFPAQGLIRLVSKGQNHLLSCKSELHFEAGGNALRLYHSFGYGPHTNHGLFTEHR